MSARGSDGGQRPRVGIDLHVADGMFQGSRTHCLELFSRVIALTPEIDFTVLAADPQKLVSSNENFARPNVTLFTMPKKAASVRLLWQLPQIVKQCKLSLLHAQYITPPLPFCATAVTIHDILFESHREYFERSFVLRSRLLVPLSARSSEAVFTVSEFSRKQICETYSIATDKVHVIPNGVNLARFFPGNAGLNSVRELGLEANSYFLTVGRLEPRKNHASLLRAWSQIDVPRPRLVIVGQRDFQYHDAIDLIRTLGLEHVSDAELPALYRNAKAFIYCSWAEGFGMPLLEAMASGIPVISSSGTALSEVGADAAIWIDPGNPREIANAIITLNKDTRRRDDLIQSGLTRAREYDWEKPAQTVRNVYRRIFELSLSGVA